MVSSLTAVAAQRRASNRRPATAAIDTVRRLVAEVRGSSPRMRSNPMLTPPKRRCTMYPLLTEMLARDHRQALLAEAARRHLLLATPSRHPLRTAVRRGRTLAPLLWHGWHRARPPQLQQCPCTCQDTAGACASSAAHPRWDEMKAPCGPPDEVVQPEAHHVSTVVPSGLSLITAWEAARSWSLFAVWLPRLARLRAGSNQRRGAARTSPHSMASLHAEYGSPSRLSARPRSSPGSGVGDGTAVVTLAMKH